MKHLSEFWNSIGNDAEHGMERKFSLEEMHVGHIEGNGGIQESLSYVLQIQEVQSREWDKLMQYSETTFDY